MSTDYNNGYLERVRDGRYEGCITISNVDLSPIEGMFFKKEGRQYLWLKRKPVLDYDDEQMKYIPRAREPRWEAYLEANRNAEGGFKGECYFMHFKYKIIGLWDKVLQRKNSRLNFFVERLPMGEQTIINNTRERNNRENEGK